ncbi:hypothetical protein BGW38_000511 [Lunasporangiospora selenospora]|uniref:Uncharacterized protein n=1 Tax=Lunasporangiospora selenospora TaxID=979761 RepID=A0A9P6KHL6_9FUNG|nr:hypothetical protein BGW38_000511 [Lunasporangiospora selenospora]
MILTLERAISGVVRMLRPKNHHRADPTLYLEQDLSLDLDEKFFWRMLFQIVAITLALSGDEHQDRKEAAKSILQTNWSQGFDIVEMPLSKISLSPVLKLADLAGSSKNLILNLHQNTLQLAQKLIGKEVETLGKPANSDLVQLLMDIHATSISNIPSEYRHKNQTDPRAADRGAGTTDAKDDLQQMEDAGQILETLILYKELPVAEPVDAESTTSTPEPQDSFTDSGMGDVEVAQEGEERDDMEGTKDVQVEKKGQESESSDTEAEARPTRQDKGKQRYVEPESSDEQESTPASSRVSMEQDTPTSVPSRSTRPQRVAAIGARKLMSRVGFSAGVPAMIRMGHSDSEFEDSEYVPAAVVKRKVGSPKPALQEDVPAPEIRSVSPPDEVSFDTTPPTTPVATSATSSTTSVKPHPKKRAKTRHWSNEEEDRLMSLTPLFQYDPKASKNRKRLVRWAELKNYDVSHGNILKHRSQVMLKDKYRELTDNGRHREQIKERARLKKSQVAEHQFEGGERRFNPM